MSDLKVNEEQKTSVPQQLLETSNLYYNIHRVKDGDLCVSVQGNGAEIAVFAFFAAAEPYEGTARRRKMSDLKTNEGQKIFCPPKAIGNIKPFL